MDIKPSEIYYSQDSINKYFDRRSSHRTQTIGQTLDQVITGNCSITSIPRISILKLPGKHKWFSVDNRRLWVFKQLERLGYLDAIKVDCTEFNYYRHGRKITTNNGGVSIRIRGDGQPGGAAHTLPDNCYDQIKRQIGKSRTENDDQQKKISRKREVHQRPSSYSTSQPTVRPSCEDREPLKSSAPQEKQSEYLSNARKHYTLQRNLSLSQNYKYTTNPSYSLSSYADRKAETSNDKSLSESDGESAGFSDRFRKMHVSHPAKASSNRSDSLNNVDPGSNVVTRSNRYPFNFKHENDAGTEYGAAAYKGSYKAGVGLLSKADTICESKPTTRQLEPSKHQHHEILRPERPNPSSSYQKTFSNGVQTVPSKTVRHIASHNTASSKVKSIEEAQPPRVQPSVAVTKSADAVKDAHSVPIKGIFTSAYGSNNSRSVPIEIGHRTKSRQSYITVEQVERNMTLLLYRQWYRELLSDTWSTYSCKSSDK